MDNKLKITDLLRRVIRLVIPATLIFAVFQARAESMSSTNYKVQNDVISIGGGNSSSTGYKAQDALGETATGENLTSTNYRGCAGFECFKGAPFITFTVKQGLTSPGTSGAGVTLGAQSTGFVTGSNGTTVNSIFITAESNATGGVVVTAKDAFGGLKRTATADLIPSATATLVAGTAGFGLCVFSATEDAGSPTAFNEVSPYNGTCTKSSGHAVGAVSTTPQSILASTGELKSGAAEILVKSAISTGTVAGSDYTDTITLIATGTY